MRAVVPWDTITPNRKIAVGFSERELAELAGRFVARADFKMKDLEPPRQ